MARGRLSTARLRVSEQRQGKDFRLLNVGEVSVLALVYSSCSWFPSMLHIHVLVNWNVRVRIFVSIVRTGHAAGEEAFARCPPWISLATEQRSTEESNRRMSGQTVSFIFTSLLFCLSFVRSFVVCWLKCCQMNRTVFVLVQLRRLTCVVCFTVVDWSGAVVWVFRPVFHLVSCLKTFLRNGIEFT